MLTLYRVFTFLVYYLVLPYSGLAALFGSKKWKNRLGYIDCRAPNDRTCPVVWMHASSMGEVKVLAQLAEELRALDTDLAFCITVMTAAGYQRAQDMLGPDTPIAYLPLDYRAAIRRFLKRVQPNAAVFIETEIWPNHLCHLGERRIPVYLANGRLSDRAVRRYRIARQGLRKVFTNYSKLMVQSEDDRSRFIRIGADPGTIEITGSLKFDAPAMTFDPATKEHLRKSLPFEPNSRILIAGSTRHGEDEIILDIFLRLQRDLPNLRLVVVPRHLDRIPDIGRAVEAKSLDYRLFSQLPADGDTVRLVIVDRMGILNDLYAVADIAFVGGTLVDIGGHNILEPVWAGIPVLYGPSIFNVRDSSEYLIENRYGDMVHDPEELYAKLHHFFTSGSPYRKKSSRANGVSRTGRTARIIHEALIRNGKALAANTEA